jgi:Uma2 family endonuclease
MPSSPGECTPETAARPVVKPGGKLEVSSRSYRAEESFVAASRVPLVTPGEYLTRERQAETKSEYIAGEILAMAGGKPDHNMIATDLARALGNRLETAGSACGVFNSDQRVRVADAGPFFYPDVTVVCGDPVFDGDDCLRNPPLIVEVLSESTADYDRGEKFRHYVLIEQDRMRVEHYRRREGVVWEPAGVYEAPADRVALPDLDVELPLAEIYRRVTFP